MCKKQGIKAIGIYIHIKETQEKGVIYSEEKGILKARDPK